MRAQSHSGGRGLASAIGLAITTAIVPSGLPGRTRPHCTRSTPDSGEPGPSRRTASRASASARSTSAGCPIIHCTAAIDVARGTLPRVIVLPRPPHASHTSS